VEIKLLDVAVVFVVVFEKDFASFENFYIVVNVNWVNNMFRKSLQLFM
jgi:hypothetical protein